MNVLLMSTQSPYEGRPFGGGASEKGGAELSLRLLGEMLASRGHRVHYLTKGALRARRAVGGVSVVHRAFLTIPLLWRWSGALARLNLSLEERQWEMRIRSLVLRHDIDVVHSYATYPDTYVAVRTGIRTGVPVVQRIAGMHWRHLWDGYPHLREAIRFTFENVDRLLPNSPNLEEALAEFTSAQGIDVSGRTSVLDIGVDMDLIDSVEGASARSGSGGALVVCVASFKPHQKRQDVLVEAMALLRDRGVPVDACLVGGGERRAEVQRMAERLDLGETVRFTGNVSRQEVVRLLRGATVYVHPTDFEGSSKALSEAMCLGLPIVASDVPGVRQLLGGGTSLLVENTPRSFAGAIQRLLDDPALARELGARARRRAVERLDPRRNVAAYEELFRSVVSGGRGGGHGPPAGGV